MANNPLRFHPQAEQEYLTSLAWYRERSLIAAINFENAFEEAVGRIREAPRRWPKILEVDWGIARRLALRAADSFWQARYYDFNVWGERKFVEKLRYIHRNPVERGLVPRAEDWDWSSFRHYLNGEAGTVEIESQWAARKREQLRIFPTVNVYPPAEKPRPSEA